MAILTFPNIVPDTMEFGVRYNTQVSTTSLSGITQTVELPGARWGGQMSFRDLNPVDSAELKAFLLELRGSSGRFYLGDLAHTSPFNTVTGTFSIETGSTPRVLRVTPSSGSFSVGDYIQIGSGASQELKMVISQTGSNPQEITVEPLVRRSDFVGQNVTYTNPTGVFLLDRDDLAKWSIRSKAKLSDLAISFVEG
jgi:hypothetical protein